MPKSTEPSLSGAVVRNHLELLSERYGQDLVEGGRAELDSGEAGRLESVFPMDWIPIKTFEAFYEAIARRTTRSVEELHWEFGQLAVERSFKTIWRVMLRFTSDEALVSRTPIFYGKTYNVGRLVSAIPTPGRGELRLEEWPAPSAPVFVRRGLCIGVGTVLRLAGRTDVRVESELARGGAEFVATWNV